MYESAKVIQMEGYLSPFKDGSRDIALDSKRLTLESELGTTFNFFISHGVTAEAAIMNLRRRRVFFV